MPSDNKSQDISPAVQEQHGEMEMAPLGRAERDRRDLVRVGKRPVLTRNFGFISILGFSSTVLLTWECALITLNIGLDDGGPSAIVYGYLIVWLGTAANYACLCELASMAPTSGGQYHWVSMLAPASCRKFVSYITGWLTVIGWQANTASSLYLSASMVQGVAVLNNPNAPRLPWQTVLIYWAAVIYCLLINAVISKLLPVFESIVLILHIVGIPAILFPLLIIGKSVNPHDIFNNFTNNGNLYTQGLAVIIGLLGINFCFLGGDAAIHMSEEIRGASLIVPRSIMTSVVLNGCLGFGITVAVLSRLVDPTGAIESNTGYAFMEIFLQAVNSHAGASLMSSIVLVMQFSCSVGLMAATSRMTWSFARDRGLPGWRSISLVNKRTSIPLASVLLTAGISVLLSLIILGSTTAFTNLVSITVVGLYASYFIANSLLLYHRLSGNIHATKRFEGEVVNTVGAQLVWGPWRMPEGLGVIVNAYAVCWAVFEMFFSFWPTIIPVTAANMQYSVVVVSGVIILATVWYWLVGRRYYNGPVIEREI